MIPPAADAVPKPVLEILLLEKTQAVNKDHYRSFFRGIGAGVEVSAEDGTVASGELDSFEWEYAVVRTELSCWLGHFAKPNRRRG